jgi:hypothetical protein
MKRRLKNQVNPRGMVRKILLSFGFLLTSFSAEARDEQFKIPEIIEINTQKHCSEITTKKDSQKVSSFFHLEHERKYIPENSEFTNSEITKKNSCYACHQGVKSKQEIMIIPKCDRLKKQIKTSGGVKKYFHTICLDCHKKMKKAGKKTGPKKCNGCHKRRIKK